ncbi:MAG: SDR family NAD(P)-dependent oxidoreductase [Gemmataceae bacterium]
MKPASVALVTGSAKKRVGFTIAETLARAGFAIAIHYRTSAADAQETVTQLRTIGVAAEAFGADLADERAVTNLVQDVMTTFGQIDVLVNSASIWQRKALEEVTAADVRDHFDTNALGTFLMCQQVGLQMVKQEAGGAIVNIGDWADVRPYLGYSAYFPSKGAVTSITRMMAVELGRRNPKIRVNAVLPGPVMLPPDLPLEEKEEAIAATLVKREGSPQNVADMVLALVQNDFVTGVCVPVDGGRTIYAPE